MSNEYRNNHYVPKWYQNRFIEETEGDKALYFLDLKPKTTIDSKGTTHQRNAVRFLGPKHCFCENDLYTTNFGDSNSSEIEKFFFGKIDSEGKGAIELFSNFTHLSFNRNAYDALLLFMSTQKLRTPKGLKWLADQVHSNDQNLILSTLLRIRQIYCAVWTECVWQIADNTNSSTKFIISDHPVTVYNRRCGPRSMWCRGTNDPDIRYHATHTIFPLSSEKLLILTNLSWVRNPYQKETEFRPNSDYFRNTLLKHNDIQILRHLEEQEVREINFIIKSRAYRYIAAGKEEWLYPEKYVSKSNWNTYGHGYLFMPDPRPINMGGEVLMGFEDGTATGFDAYGRRPWQKDYDKEAKEGNKESETLYRFKGEFARLFGQYRRGRSFEMVELDREKDSDDFHQYHLDLENMYKKKRQHR